MSRPSLDQLQGMLPRELVTSLEDAAQTASDGPPVSVETFSVLYCKGAGNHVDHGVFWKPAQLLGPCLWEAWYMGDPQNPSEYIIADGYGGAHALLWSGTSGNIDFQDGGGTEHIVSYGSASTPPPNVFSHFMVRVTFDDFSNQFIETSINGICVGKTLVPAGYTRCVTTGAGGEGTLFVMGSDHSNAKGWIAQIRGWDFLPVVAGSALLGDVFIPQRTFANNVPSYGPDPAGNVPPDFMASYIGPANQTLWPDLGRGYDSGGGYSVRYQHVGFAAAGGVTVDNEAGLYPLPHPTAIVSPTTQAPFYWNYTDSPPNRGYTPIAPPAGAKRYDSFSRPDQTYAHVTTPHIGSTESGSLGVAAWQQGIQTGVQTFTSIAQLFDRSLRPGDPAASLVYIPNASDSADMTVTVSRIQPGNGSDGMCGVAARVAADGTSCFIAFYQYIPGVQSNVYILRMDAQQSVTQIGGGAVSQTGWERLSLVCTGTTIRVLLDAAEAFSVTDTHLAGQKGAGIPFNGQGTNFAVTDFAVF